MDGSRDKASEAGKGGKATTRKCGGQNQSCPLKLESSPSSTQGISLPPLSFIFKNIPLTNSGVKLAGMGIFPTSPKEQGEVEGRSLYPSSAPASGPGPPEPLPGSRFGQGWGLGVEGQGAALTDDVQWTQ